MATYALFLKPGWPSWISVAYLLSLVSLQLKRSDKSFLKVNVPNYLMVIFVEYILLAIPLLACQVYLHYYELVGATILGLAIIPMLGLRFQRKGMNNKLIQFIPHEAFEWKSGIRKYFYFLVLIWMGAIMFSGFVGAVPVAMIILALVFLNFYELGEPLHILMASELGALKFLLRKLAISQMILAVVLLPLVFAFLIFHPQLWFIPVIEYILISCILAYAILLKYAFYQPNIKLIAGQIFIAVGTMSLFIPILIPLVWVLSIRFYFKSISNLNPYLHDFN